MSDIPTDGLQWVNKGSATNALMVNLWFIGWAVASTCKIEEAVLRHANAVIVSASPVENLILTRLDIMTAGLRRRYYPLANTSKMGR